MELFGPKTWEKILKYSYIIPTDIKYGYNILNINIQGLKNKYPFLETGIIGYTSLGNPIPYIRFGRGQKQILYCSSTHANEWITTPLVMKYLQNISESFRTGQNIYGYNTTFLFNNISLYIVPMVNPDGVDLVVGNIRKYRPDIYRIYL